MLVAALRVGNAINQGTRLGGAAAVRLESLLKMADLRVQTSHPSCCSTAQVAMSRCHAGYARDGHMDHVVACGR